MSMIIIDGKEVDEHDVYNRGYDDAEADVPRSDNPYTEDSYEAGVWDDGWFDYDANDRVK